MAGNICYRECKGNGLDIDGWCVWEKGPLDGLTRG